MVEIVESNGSWWLMIPGAEGGCVIGILAPASASLSVGGDGSLC